MKAFSASELIRLRKLYGWNQSELARRAVRLGYDTTPQAVNRLEKGGNPSANLVAAIAEALGVPTDALYKPVPRPDREAVAV